MVVSVVEDSTKVLLLKLSVSERRRRRQIYMPDIYIFYILVVGIFVSACEGEMVCKLNNPKVPFFNAPIYLQDKTLIGKVDEILGPLNEIFFTVKMEGGMTATTFKPDDKVYIGLDKLLPMDRFLPKPKVAGKGKRRHQM